MLLSLLFLTGLAGQSQTFLKASLFDKISIQPVSFATIKVLNRPFGSFSDDKGKFEVEAFTTDTLLITSIGFVTKKVAAFPLDTIFLTPVFRELPPVVISKHKIVSNLTLGINAKTDFQWGPSGFGEEFAQKISLNLKDNEYCKLKKVTLSVKRFSSETPVLLHVYSVHPSTGLPFKELLAKKHLILKDNFRNGKVIVDISSEDIPINEQSIFVSFEWLGYGKGSRIKPNSKTVLNMTNSLGESFTYSRNLVSSFFNWFPAPKVNDKTTNTIFQIEIEKSN